MHLQISLLNWIQIKSQKKHLHNDLVIAVPSEFGLCGYEHLVEQEKELDREEDF